jgi:hypothetical protein
MTIVSLALIVIAVAAIASLPPLHPAQIWAIVWALAVGAYALRLLPYIRLDALAKLLIIGATLAFISGTLFGERLSRRLLPSHEGRRSPAADVGLRPAATLVLATTVLGLFAFLAQAARAYGLHAALVSSSAVRLGVQTGVFHLTIKYIYTAVAAGALCAYCAATNAHPRRWASASVLAVLSTYFATGRATVVAAAVAALSAYALARPQLPAKRWFLLGGCVVAVIAVAVFTIGGSLIGKTFANSELATIDSPFVRHPALRPAALPYEYLSAPIAAFGLEASLAGRLPQLGGCASFGYVCSALRHGGFAVSAIPEVRPFTAAPLKWNTYTALDAPLLDGGAWAVVPAAALIGMLLGAVWLAARERRVCAILCYAILVTPVLTSPGSNDFTAPFLLGAILFTVGAVLATRLVKRHPEGVRDDTT